MHRVSTAQYMNSILTHSSSGTSGKSADVSIVIVNYNVKDFLYQCLQSLQHVDYKGLAVEIIVVDNNSHDGSIEFLEQVFPLVRYIRLDENIGFGRANNIGIEQANGTYILLLNPDTIVSEDTISTMYEYMEKNTSVGIAGCKVLNADGTFQVQCRRGFPTPWASFCKLFGLQSLFPSSPLFAQYNQTFRSENETYTIDALIGAFMFCRADALKNIRGFDPDFFMYGEDLDLCLRMKQSGYDTAYVHSTSIIHFKGESTRRSSMNEVKVFYSAMEIFARKHYGSSTVFLLFLRLGIWLRSIIAYVQPHTRIITLVLLDSLIVNCMLMIATDIRFGGYLAFPSYAYPIVFVIPPIVLLISMISIGEYVEYKPTVRRTLIGYLITFFVLSALTYYWNEYAFSRGVLLMTIGFSMIASSLLRLMLSFMDSTKGKLKERRLALLGVNSRSYDIATLIEQSKSIRSSIVGMITTPSKETQLSQWKGIGVIGDIEYLRKVVEQHDIDEIIITDDSLSQSTLTRIVQETSGLGVRYHFAKDYESVVVSRIVSDVTDAGSTVRVLPIDTFRNRLYKRLFDIVVSVILILTTLLILIPSVFLGKATVILNYIKQCYQVLKGRVSIVGITDSYKMVVEIPWGTSYTIKSGLISLASVSSSYQLSSTTISKLNEYYINNYSFALDIEIILKFVFAKRRKSD
jgi:O-antigen biosynthesis protein